MLTVSTTYTTLLVPRLFLHYAIYASMIMIYFTTACRSSACSSRHSSGHQRVMCAPDAPPPTVTATTYFDLFLARSCAVHYTVQVRLCCAPADCIYQHIRSCHMKRAIATRGHTPLNGCCPKGAVPRELLRVRERYSLPADAVDVRDARAEAARGRQQ